jgi:hypothetical protein
MRPTGLPRIAASAAFLLLAGLAMPASVAAHSGVTISGGTIYFVSPDLGSESTALVSRASDGSIEISDSTGFGGVSPGPCIPITEREARCPSDGITKVLTSVGPEADSTTSELDLKTVLQGGSGNDVLSGGPANDELTGGSGNDRLSGGEGDDKLSDATGADYFDGGPGNDSINSRSGDVDTVRCGPGVDTVTADPGDVLVDEPDCEWVQRVAPSSLLPSGPGNDLTAPILTRLKLVNPRLRLTRLRRFARISWSLSEKALVTFRLRRAWRGHLAGRRCRPGAPRRAQRSCVGFRAIGGGIDANGRAGSNTKRVGLVYHGRLFPPARYRVEALAVDASGNRSPLFKAGFRVLKRTRHKR